MNKIYKPNEFGKMIGRTVNTLQRWDREGILKARRTPTNRRYYTEEDYYNIMGIQQENAENQVNDVIIYLNKDTDRTAHEVFEKYTNDEYIFDRTTITVHLAKEYLGETFMSRSKAKRILLNADKFKVIFLDFDGIKTIGQGFADEIFRVYKNKNPEIQIIPINANAEVNFMINRSQK